LGRIATTHRTAAPSRAATARLACGRSFWRRAARLSCEPRAAARATVCVVALIVAGARAAHAQPAESASDRDVSASISPLDDSRLADAAATVKALDRVLTATVAARERSVVAIAQYRRRISDERPGPFDPDPAALRLVAPDNPDFVPTHYRAGIVIDRRGLILTNYHVLGFDTADYRVDHYVTTHDGQMWAAQIKGADPRIDLAVLELVARSTAPRGAALKQAEKQAATGELDLEVMPLGDAASLRKGSLVLALGNPYGTARDGQIAAGWGVVSNLARKAAPTLEDDGSLGSKTMIHHYGTLLQVDARLPLGMSGGALLNLRGELVGMTTSQAAQVGYETPAGYAIPVGDLFRRAVSMLKQGREVEYGFLGVQPELLFDDDHAPAPQGVRVERVVRGSPGDLAGIRRDDVVLSVNGQNVNDADALVLNVGQFPPSRRVRLAILRDGQPREVIAQLTKAHVVGRRVITARPAPWRGVYVDYPSALMPTSQLVDLPPASVVVLAVEHDSAAARAGLARGMFIERVNNRIVSDPQSFAELAANAAGPVELVVNTRETTGRKMTVDAQ
jgi:serine protease Do